MLDFIHKQTEYYNKKTKALNVYRMCFAMERMHTNIIMATLNVRKVRTASDSLKFAVNILAEGFAMRDKILEIAGKKKPQFKEGGFTGHGTDEVSLAPKIKNYCNEYEFRPKA